MRLHLRRKTALPPTAGQQLDAVVEAAARQIVDAVIAYRDTGTSPIERMTRGINGERRTLWIIDAAFARQRDRIDGVTGRTRDEREHNLISGRLLDQTLPNLIRARIRVAEERGLDVHREVADEVSVLRGAAEIVAEEVLRTVRAGE